MAFFQLKAIVNGNTSTLVSGYSISKNAGGTDSSLHNYSYAYDKNGNITAISENGTQKAAYQYNELNELIREDNAYINKSVTYSYDVGGNLISKTEYAYTTGTLGAPTAVHSYGYGDSNWKDKLTSYDGSAITYDAIGNPLSYIGGWNFTWQQGRKLATAANGQTSISYKYNSDGIRTQKTVNGTATNYYLEGGNIAWQTDGTNTIHYTYDSDGDLAYMNLNGNLYYYERNAQNDIIGLVDSNMNEVVTYTYDSWGKLLNIGGSLAGTVGKINPFRYRGYYYDTETGLYYLQSRYYDPNTGRFLNADNQVSVGSDLTGMNLFAYCGNNPVNREDTDGSSWFSNIAKSVVSTVKTAIKTVAHAVKKAVKTVVNAIKSNKNISFLGYGGHEAWLTKLGNDNASLTLGQAKGDIGGSLNKHGLNAKIEGSVNAFNMHASSKHGISTTQAEFSIGHAEGEAKAQLNQNGVCLALGGSAAAAQLKFSETLKLGGIKIVVSPHGEAECAEADIHAEFDDKELTLGAKAGLEWGAGLDIGIEW
ncbi:MAG TPA: RHS repeat-associated core domain-containing protein [Ruminiclostridium sp.]|nr:RHS repeat-associated core domain-containing protein [Ruminiclostridium sp.]